MSEHTKGRLRMERTKSSNWFLYSDAHREPVCGVANATVTLTPEEGEANARRLVACWNACEGISTEELQRTGVMSEARDALKKYDAFPELLAALRGMVADAADTYEICKEGLPEITSGKWGRLRTAQALLANHATKEPA